MENLRTRILESYQHLKNRIASLFSKQTDTEIEPVSTHRPYLLPLALGGGSVFFFSLLLKGGTLAASQKPFELDLYSIPPDSVEALYSSLPRHPFTLLDLDMHPEKAYKDFIPNHARKTNEADPSSPLYALGAATYNKFLTLLKVFTVRQGVDDNFTIRMYDKEDNTIQVHSMDKARAVFEETGSMNWQRLDESRRVFGDSLKGMYRGQGYNAADLQARWGRKNQVLEARKREESLVCYELRLAKRLGLSSLVTEIGTVETFNEDQLVSSVGARGRYQFMPSMLRTFGINAYNLKTVSGAQLSVREEQNPLLTMEASFTLAKAYSNSVGHEMAGVSAYHTGPGNIFKLYQLYLQNRGSRMPNNSVVAAFVWGLTTGYPIVSTQTKFKTYSQGYFPSLYGSMRAVEDMTIDPAKMLKTELVQVSDGINIPLSELLKVLQDNGGENMNWGYGNEKGSLYQRFRVLNPQIPLPPFEAEFVPQSGDILLTKWSQNNRVRFFLPQGATALLERIDPALLDEAATQRWDHTTFLDPVRTGEKTEIDFQYDDLVSSISRFGFTQENKDLLNNIAAQMSQLSITNPSPYRKTQLRIIKMHQDVWNTAGWQNLANSVTGSRATFQAAPRNFDTFDF